MNRKMLQIVSGVVILVAFFIAAIFYVGEKKQGHAEISLEKVGQLVSLKMNYAEIIELDQKATLAIFGMDTVKYGAVKVLFVAKGDCSVGTDLSSAKIERKEMSPSDTPTVELTLSSPRPLQYRINHDAREQGGSYLYTVDAALFSSKTRRAAVIDRAMMAAQDNVKTACGRPAVIASAKLNAETVIRTLFAANGERVIFHWV